MRWWCWRALTLLQQVQRRILAGTFVLSNKQYSSVFTKAQQLRSLLYNQVGAAFSQCDAMLLPTSVGPPPHVTDASSAGVQGLLQRRHDGAVESGWRAGHQPAVRGWFEHGGTLSMQLVGAGG